MKHVYKYGPDWIVAHSPDEAVAIAARRNGWTVAETRDEYAGYDPQQLLDDKTFTVYEEPDDDGNRWPETHTCREWADKLDPGVFASEDI